jgi:hypothetical protein
MIEYLLTSGATTKFRRREKLFSGLTDVLHKFASELFRYLKGKAPTELSKHVLNLCLGNPEQSIKFK